MEAHTMVHNANQIALFFSAYPHEEAVAGVLNHLKTSALARSFLPLLSKTDPGTLN
jgi:hypothetical protein